MPPLITSQNALRRAATALFDHSNKSSEIRIRNNDTTSFAPIGGLQPRTAAGASAGNTATLPNWIMYLGVGLGVGGAVLVGLLIVGALILRKRREHKRLVEAIEIQDALRIAPIRQSSGPEPARPVSSGGCVGLTAPLSARAGWGALDSDESFDHPALAGRKDKRRKRDSIALPKRVKRRGIPLQKLRRLTAILESPRSRGSPTILALDTLPAMPIAHGIDAQATSTADSKAYHLSRADPDDAFVCPGSPRPDIPARFAIRSPERYGASIVHNSNQRAFRSWSVGAMPAVPTNAVFGSSWRANNAATHYRSVSLGAPPSAPLPDPVRSEGVLPVIGPHIPDGVNTDRQGVFVLSSSSSSLVSESGEAMVSTPLLTVPSGDAPKKSPSFEELVAEDDEASVQTVPIRSWQDATANDSTQALDPIMRNKQVGHTSISANIARYTEEYQAISRTSSTDLTPTESLSNLLANARPLIAHDNSIGRASSEPSSLTSTTTRKVITARRISRTSVSERGSPAERKRTGVLQDISGNASILARQPSDATQGSNRSSNSNPFQWDQPLTKPSALKGSPNARKGHRRQNCVRISTLMPTILGPPPSRPTSPNIMHGIEEESADVEGGAAEPGLKFVSNQRPQRPVSTSSFGLGWRPGSRRVSLTPSSPTLSVWNAYQAQVLPSNPSDSQLSGSPIGAGSLSRQSNCSSMQSIPFFPSPVKRDAPATQLSQPLPDFILSRPSTDVDEEEAASRFDFRYDPDVELASSPPSSAPEKTSRKHRLATIHVRPDTTSPLWQPELHERSSASFPFAVKDSPEPEEVELPLSRPVSLGGDLPDTPPLSPKTMPEGFQAFFDQADLGVRPTRAPEKLTSANASEMMSSISNAVNALGGPIFPRPEEDEVYAQIVSDSATTRSRAASNAEYLVPSRSPPPMPQRDACIPSPLHIINKPSLSGPRCKPAQSVLKNAIALRRMNSEVDVASDRESRRFVRLGREPSPLLPWIANPEGNESCAAMNELFDFNFGADAHEGAEACEVWDDVDVTGVEEYSGDSPVGLATIRERSSSVWEDGENFWHGEQSPTVGFGDSSPLPLLIAPKEGPLGVAVSIQNTPKSLYDQEGFLKP